MSRDRIRILTWALAILAPATFAIAAGLHATPVEEAPEGYWLCEPMGPPPSPAPFQA